VIKRKSKSKNNLVLFLFDGILTLVWLPSQK